MIYAIILASGKGTRVNDGIDLPKQFRTLQGIPIIAYTINSLLKINRFDKIYVAIPNGYEEFMQQIIDKHVKDNKNIVIINGGKERMDSINNSIDAIVREQNITEEDIVLIHDGVRPFVTPRILNDSIEAAKKYGASVAAVAVSDTLLISENGDKVDEIPPRKLYYKGQAPDTFKLKLFISLLEKITPEDRKKITGTSQVCTLNNYPIYMVKGDDINFKITTKSDFIIADSLVKERDNND